MTYVFIDAVYEVAPVNAFVLGYKMSVSDVNFSGLWGAYDAYEAVVGGEKGLLMLTDNQAAAITQANDNTGYLYQVNLATIGYSEEAGLPVYALADDVTPTSNRNEEYRYWDGRLFVDGDTTAYTVAEDAIVVVAVPTSEGKTLEIITVEQLNDYVESLYPGNIEPDSDVYVTIHGWKFTDGKTVTELYVDYSTVSAGWVPVE